MWLWVWDRNQNQNLILKIWSWPLITSLRDIHQCCSKGFYEILTTYRCPSLNFHPPSLLVAGTDCHFLLLCSTGQGFHCLASVVDSQVQSLACSFIDISPRFWQHTDRQIQVKRCRGIPSQFGCTDVDQCDISESGATQSLWYSLLYAWYESYWCSLTPSGPFLNTEWSILCTGHHSFPQGNTVSWRHLWKRPKWDLFQTFQTLLMSFAHNKYPTNFDTGDYLKECKGDLFPIRKIVDREIPF